MKITKRVSERLISVSPKEWLSLLPNWVVIGALYALVCLTWGTTWLGIKLSLETLPPLTAAGARFVIAFPFFCILARLWKVPFRFPAGSGWFFVLITTLYFAIPYYLISFGEQFVSSGLTALIFSTMPVFILIFAVIFLGERATRVQIWGLLIGFGSLFMIFRSQGILLEATGLFGASAILLAAVMHAGCYVLTKKFGGAISVITLNALPLGIAGAGLFLTGLWFEMPELTTVSMRSLGALIYLGLVASVIGFIVYFYLLKRLSSIALSFVFIIFPAIAIALGNLINGEKISVEFIGWTALMLLGLAFTKFGSGDDKEDRTRGTNQLHLSKGRASLSSSVIDAVCCHSEEVYPEEACGFIHKDGTVHRAVNVAGTMQTGWVGPDDPNSTFLMSVADTLKLSRSFSTENPAVVIYHSHPDVGAYFSDADKESALLDGEPVYPVDHLVVDVKRGKRKGALLFRELNAEFKCIERFTVGSI